ncbi:MAG: hypothetical protein HY986_04640 [Candidatus Melainabacteria bacterium]|nr:hypothetical protein [Candidatus Melainabacteria bacterium]
MNSEEPKHWRSSKPPGWFVVVCWFYPLLYWVFGVLLFTIPGVLLSLFIPNAYFSSYVSGLYLLSFPVLPVVMLFLSSWYRKMALIIWPVSFLVLSTSCGITQGAWNAAISKAFSAVVSQTKNLQ